MDLVQVTVAFEDESQGYPISPRRVPLALLKSFSDDVAAFVRGADEVDLMTVDVEIKEGSLGYVTGKIAAPQLAADLQSLAASSNLSKVDPKRRKILERWQSEARRTLGRKVKIGSSNLPGVILIGPDTNFRAEDEETWVNVERYIHGELVDLGGAKSPNAHVKLPDGNTLIVRTDRDLIQSEKDNLVFRPVHLRIRAKYNLETQELRDPVLIEFVDYSPKFDRAAHAKLTAEGEKAWADVDDPAAWVRRLRGSAE